MDDITFEYDSSLTREELSFFAHMGGFEVEFDEDEPEEGPINAGETLDIEDSDEEDECECGHKHKHEDGEECECEHEGERDEEEAWDDDDFYSDDLVYELVHAMFEEGPDEYAELACENRLELIEENDEDPDVGRAVAIGYKMGVSLKNAPCANNLGTLYYLGELVEQDYAKAAQLFQLAIDWGSRQSLINLGYIYELGSTGEPDYQKAYQCYALAVALEPSCEALCKLGDMYACGMAVDRDLGVANDLWERAFDEAEDVTEVAQAALRLGKLYLEPEAEELDVESPALQALSLFQQAEIGLRTAIDQGVLSAREQLQATIDGQAEARQRLDAEE